MVDNRAELSYPVYISLPGGRSGNEDPTWAKVKENSKARCGCGNEREIIPLVENQRTEYMSSSLGELVISPENEVYLRPIGGNEQSTYVKLSISEGHLAFTTNPFAPAILSAALFGNGYDFKNLERALEEQRSPLVFSTSDSIPLFAIKSVDPNSNSVTITPDSGVEIYNPAAQP